jgi:MFS family permease
MIVTGIGLAGLAFTISVDTPIWQLALWQLIVGAGSGLFASPNTRAVMGAIPPEKRGMGSGARMMLTQLGFMISIALALGIVTSVVNPEVLLAVFSGAQTGASGIDLDPFIHALQLAFAIGVVFSIIGAVVSAMRGAHTVEDEVGTPVAA